MEENNGSKKILCFSDVYESFRDQNTFVISLLVGKLCYQLPALIKEGTAIVVSPLH